VKYQTNVSMESQEMNDSLITLIDGNSSSPKRYRSIIIILSIFHCCVFLSFFFFCVIYSVLVARAAVTHFPSAHALTHTHSRIRTRARARARTHTHTHTHTHTRTHATCVQTRIVIIIYPSPLPSSSSFLVFTCQQLCINNHVTDPFFVFFFSSIKSVVI